MTLHVLLNAPRLAQEPLVALTVSEACRLPWHSRLRRTCERLVLSRGEALLLIKKKWPHDMAHAVQLMYVLHIASRYVVLIQVPTSRVEQLELRDRL